MTQRKQRVLFGSLVAAVLLVLVACMPTQAQAPADAKIQQQQERLSAEGNSQLGLPAITNFREKRILKDIYELRDQAGLVTYTYVWPENLAKPVFLCNSIGYGIPYATQYTAPEKSQWVSNLSSTAAGREGWLTLPQADPNGLFSPASADGTWILCKEPNSDDVKPQYVEPHIITLTFRLTE